jgi:hypothetical protein
LIQPLGEEPEEEFIDSLLRSENTLICNIKNKLNKLSLQENLRNNLLRQLVQSFVVGQGELERLNVKFPDTYKSILQLKDAKESQLAIRMLARPSGHGAILNDLLKEYEGKLGSSFNKSLSNALITLLSTEAISDWLGRCPIDFPNKEGSHDSN